MTIYTANVSRDENWWVVTVDEVPGLFTQAKRLDQIPAMVKDALTLFPELENSPASATIRLAIQGDIGQLSSTVQDVRDQAERAQTISRETMRNAARVLANQGLPYRDIGELLGVSFQRAQKLATT